MVTGRHSRALSLAPFLSLLWLFVAGVFLVPSPAWADDIKIKSVDNYAGNSNVYTDRKNTTVKIIELDHDKKPVRSWTGLTDADGKITIPAGSNLAQPYLKGETASEDKAPEGVVAPDEIAAGEPFTFAATGVVAGEVISIQTAEGEVVTRATADRHGRVYLKAGLAAAGLYRILAGARTRPAGDLRIQDADDLEAAGPAAGGTMTLDANAIVAKAGEPLSLHGTGFNANASEMAVSLGGNRQGGPVVLAATSDQLIVGGQDLKAGVTEVTVSDQATGRSTPAYPALIYDLKGALKQTRMVRPVRQQTALEVTFAPSDLTAQVRAEVLSGPVHLGENRKEATAVTQNGVATFPVHADAKGDGRYQLTWHLESVKMSSGANGMRPELREALMNMNRPAGKPGWTKIPRKTGKQRLAEAIGLLVNQLENADQVQGGAAEQGTAAQRLADGLRDGAIRRFQRFLDEMEKEGISREVMKNRVDDMLKDMEKTRDKPISDDIKDAVREAFGA